MESDNYENLLKSLMDQLQQALELKSASKSTKVVRNAFMDAARKMREIEVGKQRKWPIYGS